VGVFTVFFDVAYQSYLPSLVDRADLVEGNAKLEVSQSAAQVAGRALAGFLIRVIGAAKAIAVDAGAFLTSAVVLLSIRKPEPKPSPNSSGSDPGFIAELKEGAQVVFKNPILMRIAACTATSNLGGSIAFTVFLIFAYNQLKLTPEMVGIIFAVGSVGLLIGALVAAKVAKRLGLGWALAIAIIVGGIAVLGVPLALVASPILVLAILQAFGGFWLVLYNINQVSLRQAITPDRLQGRMNATMRTIVWGTIPAGSFIGGILGTQIGVMMTIVTGGILATLGAAWILFGPVISLKETPATP